MDINWAILDGGNVVINVAVGDEDGEFPDNWHPLDTGKKGDTRDPVTGDYSTPAAVVVIPETVARYQFKKALIAVSKFAQFKTYLSTAPDDVAAYFQDKNIFNRTDAEIELVRIALGRTDAQVDQLFIDAKAVV